MSADDRRRSAFVLARVRRVRRRLDAKVALDALVVPIWAGVAVFTAWRFVVQRGQPVIAGLLTAAVGLYWWWRWNQSRPTMNEAAVIADRQADAGGLLLTRLEAQVGGWELGLNERLRNLPMPKVHGRRALALVSLALLFLCVAVLVPLPPRVVRPVNAAAASKLDEVEQKLEAVAREEPLDEAVQQELERLKDELADGNFDAADWEAADSLSKELDQKAQEAGAELSKADAAAKDFEDALGKSAQGAEAATKEQEALEQALMALSDGQAQNAEQAMQQAMGEQNQQGKDGEQGKVGSSRVDLQACKLEYSIVSPK